uniref:Xylulose kinase-1 n=1 Tax=Tanacetum cinerariifolium TaxID=118510 RepID=A0A699H2I8_TANCI|nr:hypothetical protein [Tanacetum cinerariifolium]
MTTPTFADVHNMVSFLAKPTENEGFEQIIDFLNANPIKYALTVNPTVLTSCIKQFWTILKAKNINGEAQIHAKVDGKKVIITEASIRRDLRFGDEGVIDCFSNEVIFKQLTLMGVDNHTRTYVKPSHIKKVFGNIRRVGKDFSGKITPLFPTMMVQAQEKIGEGSACPNDPHHTPTIIQPLTSQPSRKHKSRKTKRKDTELPQTSVPTEHVADEAVNEEMDDSLKKATTTATSLYAEQDRGNISKTQSKATPNEPSSLGTSSGGGPRRQDTMGDTIAQTRSENVSKFSNDPLLAGVNTPRNLSSSGYYKFEKEVKILEKKRRSRTHGLKRLFKVGLSAIIEFSADEESLGEEDVSKQRRIYDIDANQDIYLVNVHRDKDIFGVNNQDDTSMFNVDKDLQGEEVVEKKVAGKDVSVVEEINVASIATSITATAPTISMDEITLAKSLIEIKTSKTKVKGIVIQEPSETPTPTSIVSSQQPSKVQDNGKGIMVEPEMPLKKKAQISLDEEFAFKLQAEEDEQERIVREKAQQIKEQMIENENEFSELKRCLEIVPDDGDDVTIDATPLSSKSPTIVDYKIYKEWRKSFFQIFNADVKDIFIKTKPVDDMDSFLMHTLKTMFEHYVKDIIWKSQQGLTKVKSWKLFYSCRGHCVTMQNILYYLLVEKMYPLTNHTLHQMFSNVKLQVNDECEMAYEIPRLVKKQLKE